MSLRTLSQKLSIEERWRKWRKDRGLDQEDESSVSDQVTSSAPTCTDTRPKWESSLRTVGCVAYARGNLATEARTAESENQRVAIALRSAPYTRLGTLPSVSEDMSLFDDEGTSGWADKKMWEIGEAHQTLLTLQNLPDSPKCHCSDVSWEDCTLSVKIGGVSFNVSDESGVVLDEPVLMGCA